MRNGCSQFPIAVKHLARAGNNQTFRAVQLPLSLFLGVCFRVKKNLALAQNINYRLPELSSQDPAKKAECARKNVKQQLQAACAFWAHSYVHVVCNNLEPFQSNLTFEVGDSLESISARRRQMME